MSSRLPPSTRRSAASADVTKTDARPGPSDVFGMGAAAAALGEAENDFFDQDFENPENVTRSVSVRWAADKDSPCYRHLLGEGQTSVTVDKSFELTRREMELLIGANSYKPQGHGDTISFGVRGATLRGAEKFENVDRVPLDDARPNHVNFRCVIGWYNLKTGKFSAYTGSTVPWHAYMSKGMRHNLLPPGCYVYKLGSHRPANQSRWVTPALRLSDLKGSDSGLVTVLRNTDDLIFDYDDEWDKCAPSDNIHTAYSNNGFSSLGCQTIKGTMTGGLWADFQRHLKTLPAGVRVDYVMFTGAEASIAAKLLKGGATPDKDAVKKALGRLRFGSEGERVNRLQAKLGLAPTGYFGASTKEGLIAYQDEHDIASDGIYSPALDTKIGWDVLADVPAPAPQPTPAPVPTAPAQPATAPVATPAPIPPQQPLPVPVAQPAPTPAPQPSPAPVAQPVAVAQTPPTPAPDPAPQVVAQPAPAPTPAPAVADGSTGVTGTLLGGPATSGATLAAIEALAAKAREEAAATTSPAPQSTPSPVPAPAPIPVPIANEPAKPPVAQPAPPPAPAPPVVTQQPAPAPIPVPTPAPQPAPAPTPPVAAPSPAPSPVPTPKPAPSPAMEEPAILLTAETLKEFAPKARADYLKVLGEQGNEILSRFGINKNDKRFCHFMAQVGHECGGFTIVEESGAYSAKGIMNIFGVGKHSASVTQAEAQQIAAIQPTSERGKVLFERVYGPARSPRKARDLGNTQPGDGYRYRGRGFLQITGRSAYREMGKRLGLDLENNPDLAGEPIGALGTAAAFWDSRKLNTYADQDNIEIITKRINGGHNGLADRKAKYAKAQEIWGTGDTRTRSAGATRSVQASPTLEYGEFNSDVVELKRRLAHLGYGDFVMDEDFSKATHLAVASFQIDRGLQGSGIVDIETWNLLDRDAKAAGYAQAATRSRDGKGVEDTTPAANQDIEPTSYNWGRGRAVWIWGVVLLVAAAALIGVKALEVPNVLRSQSPLDWITLTLAALVGVGGAILTALGHRIARSSRRRAVVRAGDLRGVGDEGLRRESEGGAA